MTAIQFLRYAGLCLLLGIIGCGLPDPARAAEEPGPSASLFAAPFYSCVRNFYVATTGNDTNAGTQSSPWLTIQHADSSARAAGDCINVAPGTYKADVLITHGGDAPTASGYVAYRCQTLDGCHVLAPGAGPLWGIAQPANFVVVDGFELDGNNALLADGIASVCLLTSGDTYGIGNSSHHIWALNNIVHHCNLAGIALQNKEWYYAIHNTAYHNAFTSGFQGSGIAYVVVQCIESGNAACASGSTYKGGTGTYTPSGNDTAAFNAAAGIYTPFHNVVAWNHVYDNLISASNSIGCSAHTDGNGIILDTFYDETTNTIAFPFQTLLSGNVAHGNGARGIHIYKTSNATIANNTAYGNGTDTCNNSFGLADLSQAGGSNNVWINNVAQAVVTAANPSCGLFCGHNNIPLIAGNAGSVVDTNNTYLNNVLYGGVGVGPLTHGSTGVGLYNNDLTYFSCSNNKCNTNPLLVNPGAGNFAVQAGSPAIGYGTAEAYLPSTAVDAGSCSSSLTNCPQTVAVVTSVTSVSPSSGPAAGGTAVTVSGAGFTGATAVTFGGAAGTGMTVVNDGKITVTSPAGTAGTVDIIVTTPAGASGTTTNDKFTYSVSLAPPVAGSASATVAYDSTNSAVSLALGGGAASSVAVAKSPGHGTATASGTSITYAPATGYFGADSFTYTASNSSGTSAAATVSVTVSAPTISVSPSALPGGAVGTAYSQSLTASGGQAPYSFSTSLASGTLPGGLSLSAGGVISGVPTASGTFTFTVHGTDSSTTTPASFTSAQLSLTISAAVSVPTASPVSATVAYDSTKSAVSLALGGGAASSVAVAKSPGHGTATASGTSITYTPATGYFGADSFTYTASNSSGTSAAATVSVTVSAPTISVSPSALPGGAVGTAYSQSLTASGGQAPYSFSTSLASGALPGGLSLSGSGVISGVPTASGTFTFTVHGTDSSTTTPASFTSAQLSLTISAAVSAPTASPVSAKVTYGSTKNAVSLVLGGGAASSVAVAKSPGHGTATASGTSITYTPVTGYFGADSFTYTASNSSGTSAAATVSVTVSAPTISVLPSALPGGAVGTAYSQSLTASGGQAPYSFSTSLASGTLPGGLSLSGSGVISGVPTAIGTFTFTVHGTDSSTATPASFTSAQITLTISAATGVPSVSTVIPSTGSSSGGGVVAIIGANFNGATAVKFGGKAATGVTLVSSTWISATAPAGIGKVDVTVTAPGGTSAVVAADKYSYVASSGASGKVYPYQNTLGVSGVGGNDDKHFSQPAAGAIDLANGRLFVADTGNHRIQVLDATSLSVAATVGVAGISGGDNAHLNAPCGVVYDSAANHVIVADTGNHRVQVFDGRSFAYLFTLGATGVSGADNQHFDEPASVHLNEAAHQLYIADQGNHRVQIYDSGSFAYLATLGTSGVLGSDNAHLSQPRDAEFNPNSGQIMVADTGNSRIQLFDAGSFQYATTLGGAAVPASSDLYFGTPVAIAFDPSSNLVLIADESTADRVQALDPLTYQYVLTLGTTGSSGLGSNQFAGPTSVVPDTAHARIFVNDVRNNRIQIFGAAAPMMLASVLPGGRSVELGQSATVYATMINSGSTALTDCAITLPATAPAGLLLSYQTTDAATNTLTGTPNTPVSIAGNDASQSFLLSFQGAQTLSMSDMPLDFACAGAAPATIAVGVNSIDLTMSNTPTADVIALAATSTGNGVIEVPTDGSAAFAVATTNAGAAAAITVSVDTGAVQLPASATICQSDPKTGNCVAPPTPSITLQLVQGDTATFSVFLQSTGPIAFAPASSRVFVHFKDSSGSPHGSTSVAIKTL